MNIDPDNPQSQVKRKNKAGRLALLTVCALALSLLIPVWLQAAWQEKAQNDPPPKPVEASGARQKITRNGITIELAFQPLGAADQAAELIEGSDYEISVRLADGASGTPLAGLRPAAWIDPRIGAQSSDAKVCREKIQTYVRGSLRARPEIDLNNFYILALNNESNISVIDPLLSFGGSKLLTLIRLNSPGEDWALSRDQRRLFVTQPKSNQVAVIDTSSWQVIHQLDAGTRPVRIVLQPDEKYLWVGNDVAGPGQPGGVTAIDLGSLKIAAHVKTGAGHHELAITPDDRFLFATNQLDGTLSVIEVRSLTKVKEFKVGDQPISLAYSPLSRAVYVASENSGGVTVIDASGLQTLSTIKTGPGLRALRFTPDGRWGFVANRQENAVLIFDAATNQIRHVVNVPDRPDQITFTRSLAFVRSAGATEVGLIRLSSIGSAEINMVRIPGGQIPPEQVDFPSVADSIVPAPELNSALVSNAPDGVIYYYMEGMTSPSGNIQNYRRQPRAITVVDRSLREKSPGVYATNLRFSRSGEYEVAFMLNSPRIFHCFSLAVKPNPALKKKPETVALQIEPLIESREMRAGEEFKLRFKVVDATTRQPREDLKDIGVLTFLTPGAWQNRGAAKAIGAGAYETGFTPPKSGVYYVFFQCPSLKLKYNELPPLILQAN